MTGTVISAVTGVHVTRDEFARYEEPEVRDDGFSEGFPPNIHNIHS
jgi:hypothetical protein